MAFNINDIKSKVNEMKGLQVPNLCQVKFSPREGQLQWANEAKESLSLLGYAFAIPALNLVTTQIKRQGFGVPEQSTTNYSPSTISLEFFLDNKNMVLDFFNQWALRHANYQVGSEASVTPINGQDAFFGQVGYQDDYAMDLDIEIYSPMSDKPITEYKIRDAAIINLGNVELGWQQNNELTTLTVQLSYRSFIPKSNPVPQGASGGKGLNLFQFISKMKGAVEVVKSFEKPSNVQDALNLLNNAKTLGQGFD